MTSRPLGSYTPTPPELEFSGSNPHLTHVMSERLGEPREPLDAVCTQLVAFFADVEPTLAVEGLLSNHLDRLPWLFPADGFTRGLGGPHATAAQIARLVVEPMFATNLVEHYRWFLQMAGLLRDPQGGVHFDRRQGGRIASWSTESTLDMALARVLRCLKLSDLRGRYRISHDRSYPSDHSYAEWLFAALSLEVSRERGAGAAGAVTLWKSALVDV